MAVFRRNGDGPEESLVEQPAPPGRHRAAWFGGFVAMLTPAILIVFMLPEGTVPLALALLIAGAGAALVMTLFRRGTRRSAGSDRHTGRVAPPG